MSDRFEHDDIRQLDDHEGWRGACRLLGVDPDQHEEGYNA